MTRSRLVINILAPCGFLLLTLLAHHGASRYLSSRLPPAAWSGASTTAVTAKTPDAVESSAVVRYPFIANQGQTSDEVAFYAPTAGGTVFVTRDGEIVYALPKAKDQPGLQGMVLKETLATGHVADIRGRRPAVTKVNHFVGNDPSRWRRNIPTYEFVDLDDVRDGIDLTLKAHADNVEKLFCVHPGARPADISVRLSGATGLRVNHTGELEVNTELGVVTFTKPVAYQEDNGQRKYVDVSYAPRGNEYGFDIGTYDSQRTLIIEPLPASIGLSGNGGDELHKIPAAPGTPPAVPVVAEARGRAASHDGLAGCVDVPPGQVEWPNLDSACPEAGRWSDGNPGRCSGGDCATELP